MTKTEWDYTQLADAYLKRPQYASSAIDEMFSIAQLQKGDKACDVGAGVAHLSILLAERGLIVHSVEPNDAMRRNGALRTNKFPDIKWFDGTGESTGQPNDTFDIATFGSSFNVTDRSVALRETQRILRPGGWFACMWNHRNLEDEIQASIESIISRHIGNYSYGTRREDQKATIESSGLFDSVIYIEGSVIHEQTTDDCIEAWRSHATLERQAGPDFNAVIEEISQHLFSLNTSTIKIPYTTRLWMASSKSV